MFKFLYETSIPYPCELVNKKDRSIRTRGAIYFYRNKITGSIRCKYFLVNGESSNLEYEGGLTILDITEPKWK